MAAQDAASTYVLRLRLPRRLEGSGPAHDREEFLAWAWREFSERGLLGVHEGSVFEPWRDEESQLRPDEWEVDFGLVDQGRDWIGRVDEVEAELYFETEKTARAAMDRVRRIFPSLQGLEIREQRPEDWNAKWREAFKGIEVPPYFSVLPPWRKESGGALPREKSRVLWINPGAGFGTGSHETTRLCLAAIGQLIEEIGSLEGRKALDFGSGSGILAIAAAMAGAKVEAVEIDELANQNAAENCEINGVSGRVSIGTQLPATPKDGYDLVVANILKPVLLEFADRLVGAMAPHGDLVLSGLIDADVRPVRAAYEQLLKARGRVDAPEVGVDGEWRRLHWKGPRR